MKKFAKIVLLVLAFGSISLTASGASKVIKLGRLIDGSGKVITNAVIVVEDDRVQTVGGSETSIPAGAEVIDLSPFTGIPGLIDVHTHLAGPGGAPSRVPNEQPARHPAIDMFLGQPAARRMLESGVTTIRNMGALQFMDIAMRDLINQGAIIGPRMFVSGPGIRTSSSLGIVMPEVTVDGAAEVMRAVRRLIGAGVDHIKMFGSTGAVLDLTGYQTFTYDEFKAAVDVAHNLGKKVGVHSYGPMGARDAVRAGVDSVEHAIDMDDATLTEMAKRGTFYVPTIDHNRFYLETRVQTPEDKTRFNDFIARNLETARRAFKAGVRFAMGSDGGAVNMIGETTRELAFFVKAGMTPAQALETATTNAAVLLGREKEIGSVAPGYFADIAVVDGDPLKDINVVINNVRWVMKAGVIVVDKTKNKSN